MFNKSSMNADADSYFASMNPMAKRIVMDTIAMQQVYGEKWKKLNYSDQCEIITKGFLKPAVTEKYPNVASEEEGCFPKLNVSSGQKYIFEEGGGNRSGKSWRDEHSGPFIWESQSQLNLSYILQDSQEATDDEKIVAAKEEMSTTEEDVRENEDEPAESKTVECTNSGKITPKQGGLEAQQLKMNHPKRKPAPPIPKQTIVSEEPREIQQMSQVKKEQLVVPPYKKQQQIGSPLNSGPEVDQDDEGNDIPKTGFDFLDNW